MTAATELPSLEHLPPKPRAVVQLIVLGWTATDVAVALGISGSEVLRLLKLAYESTGLTGTGTAF